MVRKTETNTPSPSSQVQFHSSIPSSSTSFPRSFTRGYGRAPSWHSLLFRLFPWSSMGLCQGLQFLSEACSSMLQGNTFHDMVSLRSELQGNLWGGVLPSFDLVLPISIISHSFHFLLCSLEFCGFFPILKYVFHEVPALLLLIAQLCPLVGCLVGWNCLEPSVLSMGQP